MRGHRLSGRWFEDPLLVAQMPIDYRMLAAYCRSVRKRPNGEAPGLWRAWVALGELRRRVHGRTDLLLDVAGVPLAVDLLDTRALTALEEVRGVDPESQLFSALLRPGDSFLDIGANHGAYALVASKLVGPEGRVLAFEPQPRLAALVRRSFVAAGRPAEDVFEVACSDVDGEARLSVPKRASGGGTLFAALAPGSPVAYSVRTRRLDEVIYGMALPGRLVVKLDVEGAEVQVLRGAAQTLAARQPPLLVELSPQTSRGAGHPLVELVDELGRLGYLWFSTPATYPEVHAAQDLDLGRQYNVLALSSPP